MFTGDRTSWRAITIKLGANETEAAERAIWRMLIETIGPGEKRALARRGRQWQLCVRNFSGRASFLMRLHPSAGSTMPNEPQCEPMRADEMRQPPTRRPADMNPGQRTAGRRREPPARQAAAARLAVIIGLNPLARNQDLALAWRRRR